MSIRRIAWLVEFDGSIFHGWQQQSNAHSVQAELVRAWRELTGETINLTGSSRTDSGVHAKGHVSSFKTGAAIPADRIHLAMNTKLQQGVSVIRAIEVDQRFNARFDAIGKHYRYTIWHSASRPAIARHIAYHVPGQLI